MKVSEISFVILIDTCAMSALSLYVDSCMALNKNLGINIDTMKKEYERQRNTKEIHLNFDAIGPGFSLYNYLQAGLKTYDHHVKFLFSILSEIELLTIFLERTFHKILTDKGIPYRIRTKKLFKLQVDFDYEEEIMRYWNNIKIELYKNNIEFESHENEPGNMTDTLEIVRIISRHIALHPVDMYLYALGIFERCDEIYTRDSEFKKVINNIYHKNEGWRTSNKNIQEDLRKYAFSFEEQFDKEGEIKLPKGVPTRRSSPCPPQPGPT